MTTFKPGMLVLTRGCGIPENNGRVLQLVKPIVVPDNIDPKQWFFAADVPPIIRAYFFRGSGKEVPNTRFPAYRVSEACLIPLSDPGLDVGNLEEAPLKTQQPATH